MSEDSERVVCSDCKTVLNQQANDQTPCSQCGSTQRTLHIEFEDSIAITEWFDMKVKNHSLPSAKKLRVHMQSGQQFSVRLDRYVDKDRILDKENNRYLEKVTDPLTGDVLRNCDESLAEHQGHGSAKFKTAPPTDSSED